MDTKDLFRFFMEPEKEVHWAVGYELLGFTVKKQDENWLLVIRVKGKNEKALVTFIAAHTVADCWMVWLEAMHTRNITLKWHEDKFQKV